MSFVAGLHIVKELLTLTVLGTQRHTHVMSAVLGDGLTLFAGLKVIPIRAYLGSRNSRVNRVNVTNL